MLSVLNYLEGYLDSICSKCNSFIVSILEIQGDHLLQSVVLWLWLVWNQLAYLPAKSHLFAFCAVNTNKNIFKSLIFFSCEFLFPRSTFSGILSLPQFLCLLGVFSYCNLHSPPRHCPWGAIDKADARNTLRRAVWGAVFTSGGGWMLRWN